MTVVEMDTVEVGRRKVGFGQGEMRDEVSRQWVSRNADERFLDLNSLRDHCARRKDSAIEGVYANRHLEMVAPEVKEKADTHRFSVGLPGGAEVGPTHWAFGQLCGLAGAPGGYMRTLPSQLVADNLTWGMRHVRDVEQVKAYSFDDMLHAVTGPTYGRIYDADVVEAVQQIAGNGTGDERWKAPGVMDWRDQVYDPDAPITIDSTTFYASDRDVFMFLVDDRNPIEIGRLPSGEPDYIFRGFYISNSEVGNGALHLAAFYLRGVCCNRLLWGVEGFQELSIRHSKYAPDRFIESARPALSSFAEGSVQNLLDGVEKARTAKVASDDEEAFAFLNNRGFTKSRAKAVLETVEREEGRKARSIWDFAQGITAEARDTANTDERLELELSAKRLLDKVA